MSEVIYENNTSAFSYLDYFSWIEGPKQDVWVSPGRVHVCCFIFVFMEVALVPYGLLFNVSNLSCG